MGIPAACNTRQRRIVPCYVSYHTVENKFPSPACMSSIYDSAIAARPLRVTLLYIQYAALTQTVRVTWIRYLFYDRPEDASIALIVDTISEREVDGVVLSLPHTWKIIGHNINTCQVSHRGQNMGVAATRANEAFCQFRLV